MIFTRLFNSFWLVACWLTISLSALSAGERTCRVLFIGPADSAPERLQLFSGKSSQEIELPRMNFSEIYVIPPGAITLRLLEKAPEKPEDIPADAPKVTLSEGVSDFYLLVSTNPNNKVIPVSMQVIDANAAKFRKGQLLWFNLTKYRIGGILGSQKLALEPNSREVSSAPASKHEQYPVKLFYQIPGNKTIEPLCETQWLHNPSGRFVMFVLPDSGSRIPRIMGFPDFRAEKE